MQTGMSWELEGGRLKSNFMHESTFWCMATNPTQRLHPGRAQGPGLCLQGPFAL